MARPKYLPDTFTFALVGTVVLASLVPCRGEVAIGFNWLTNLGIGLLFFMHGAKLPRQAVIDSAKHWRLHLVVLLCTFAMFPLLGFALKPLLSPLVTPALYAGVLFLCMLPSTVQASIAFTSMAKGNVPAAVCSASASSLLGIFITPMLAGLLIVHHSAANGAVLHSVRGIVLQLLVPFLAGHLLRPVIGGFIERHKVLLRFVDQGSIVLVVYTAFSEATNEGLWHQLPGSALAGLLLINAVLLGLALFLTGFAARRLGFSRADQITIVFCGSKKSLASGIPIAKLLFAGPAVGAVVLPLMLFHQMQLMTCAMLAQRWGARDLRAETAAAAAKNGGPAATAQR
jgi:sodium/bile acid cotransporter 7